MKIFEGTYEELKQQLASLSLEAQVNIRIQLVPPQAMESASTSIRQNDFLAANAVHGAYPRPKMPATF